jgi:hypothetical protein
VSLKHWTPCHQQKFGFDVETDDMGLKRFVVQIMGLSGESKVVSREVPKWLKSRGRRLAWGFGSYGMRPG